MAARDLIPWSRQENRLPHPVAGPRDGQGYNPLLLLHREMNRLFDNVLHRLGQHSFANFEDGFGWPQVELDETDSEIRVTAELSGLNETDVDIAIEEGVLSLRGKKKTEIEERDRGYSERSYRRFERRIALPRGIERDKANAVFRNGVLAVTLPNSAAADENVRRIPVNAKSA